MNALLSAVAIPGILAVAAEFDRPPPDEFWIGCLWVVSLLCVAFALYLLAESFRERIKKFRRSHGRNFNKKSSALLRTSSKPDWPSDDDRGTA